MPEGILVFLAMILMAITVVIAIAITVTVFFIIVIFVTIITVRRGIGHCAVTMLMAIIAAGFATEIMSVFSVRRFHCRTGSILNQMPMTIVAFGSGRSSNPYAVNMGIL
jgi:hypothetical protein